MQASFISARRFFNRYGHSRALFLWLHFRSFLAQPDWQSQASDFGKPPVSASSTSAQQLTDASLESLLHRWYEHTDVPQLHPFLWVLLNIAALFVGSFVMIAALNYSLKAPINLWLIFGLFSMLPLSMTLISAIGVLCQQRRSTIELPAMAGLVFRSVKLPANWKTYGQLVAAWAIWQAQSLALLSSVGALAGFFLVALFRDLSFGWSSTLITETDSMQVLFYYFSLPWNWLVALPSEEIISASRYFQNMPLSDPNAGRHWWATVVMAILCYGIVPRVLLQQWLRLRFNKTLQADIENSGDLERFIHGCQRIRSVLPAEAEKPGDKTCAQSAVNFRSNYQFLTWQLAFKNPAIHYQLGIQPWRDDVEWIRQHASHFSLPVMLLASVYQTPTGELADCIELLKEQGCQINIALQATQSCNQAFNSAYRSWQYFAQQQGLALFKLEDVENGSA